MAIKNAVDTAKFSAYKNLYYYYLETHEREKTLPIANEMIRMGKEKNSNYYQGTGYRILGDYYHHHGKDNLATENFLLAISLLEKTNQYVALSSAYTNIGGVYFAVYGPKEAAVYFQKALGLLKNHNLEDDDGVPSLYNNLGICAANDNNLELAKFYFKSALSVWLTKKDSASIAYGYNNLGEVNLELKQRDSAEFYFKRALQIKLNFGSKEEIIGGYAVIAMMYLNEKNYKRALEFFKQGEKYIDTSDVSQGPALTLQEQMVLCYEKMGDFKNAYLYQKKVVSKLTQLANSRNLTGIEKIKKAYSDSLINANEKQIQELEIANQNAQIEKDKQEKLFLLIGFTLVLVGGILFYNRYKVTKKQKVIIESQKSLVEEQNSEITIQRDMLEEKQKEIIDSINYAHRIQQAVMNGESAWEKISSDYFILFKPKDIVSGDFYWTYSTLEKSIWACADCTGHGVPGAFMSMLGNSFLNQIVVENKITNPAQILNALRIKIIESLEKEGANHSDGMDISLCCWNKVTNVLEFAGANNSAMVARNGELIELKADKMPVGKFHGNLDTFTTKEISLQKNDIIFSYTDGYADQFGGPKGKKFRYKTLDEMLLNNASLSMSQQKQVLESTFLTWKGGLIQTDDVCIVGIKVVT